jgi:hypothetical protein
VVLIRYFPFVAVGAVSTRQLLPADAVAQRGSVRRV